jgi:hypothetical protein
MGLRGGMFVAFGVVILLSVVEITGTVEGVDFILLGSFFVDALVVVARFERPKRCTLPITAFLVTPPSSLAIWLADLPSPHIFLRISTRSSVQAI